MLDQSNGIIQAAEIVVGTVGTPQDRLGKGFKALREATLSSSDWPVELWEKYDSICGTLLAGGTWQKTIDKMDLKTASECSAQVSAAMKDLAAAVEAARSLNVTRKRARGPQPVVRHPETRLLVDDKKGQ